MKLSVSSLCRGLLATAFAIITLTAASAAGSFEGRVHMDMISKKDTVGIDYAIKDGKMRIDMPQDSSRRSSSSGSGGIIFDAKNQEMIILMEHDGRKNFMRRSMAATIDAAATKARADGHQPSVPVATGRTETIAGYPATEYRGTGDKGEIYELWLAKGLGTFMSMPSGNPMGRSAPPPGWENFARDGNFFPLRVVSRDAKGSEKSRMEVTKIEKTSLPDSLFSTDGYEEFKMPNLGSLFGH